MDVEKVKKLKDTDVFLGAFLQRKWLGNLPDVSTYHAKIELGTAVNPRSFGMRAIIASR